MNIYTCMFVLRDIFSGAYALTTWLYSEMLLMLRVPAMLSELP